MALDEGIPVITILDVQRTIGNAAVDAERHFGVSAATDAAEGSIYTSTYSFHVVARRREVDAE